MAKDFIEEITIEEESKKIYQNINAKESGVRRDLEIFMNQMESQKLAFFLRYKNIHANISEIQNIPSYKNIEE